MRREVSGTSKGMLQPIMFPWRLRVLIQLSVCPFEDGCPSTTSLTMENCIKKSNNGMMGREIHYKTRMFHKCALFLATLSSLVTLASCDGFDGRDPYNIGLERFGKSWDQEDL